MGRHLGLQSSWAHLWSKFRPRAQEGRTTHNASYDQVQFTITVKKFRKILCFNFWVVGFTLLKISRVVINLNFLFYWGFLQWTTTCGGKKECIKERNYFWKNVLEATDNHKICEQSVQTNIQWGPEPRICCCFTHNKITNFRVS